MLSYTPLYLPSSPLLACARDIHLHPTSASAHFFTFTMNILMTHATLVVHSVLPFLIVLCFEKVCILHMSVTLFRPKNKWRYSVAWYVVLAGLNLFSWSGLQWCWLKQRCFPIILSGRQVRMERTLFSSSREFQHSLLLTSLCISAVSLEACLYWNMMLTS